MKKTVIKWILITLCIIVFAIDMAGFWNYKLKGTNYKVSTSTEPVNEQIQENIEQEINYEELTSQDFSNNERLFITDINPDENQENKYIIKGLIYEEYEFSKEEYNAINSQGSTVQIFDKEYSKDKIQSNNLILKSSDSDAGSFYIKYDTNTKKYILVESTTDYTVYKSTEKYVQTTVDGDLDFIIQKNGKSTQSTVESEEEYYKNIQIPTDTIQINLCELTFNKNDICTKITITELN